MSNRLLKTLIGSLLLALACWPITTSADAPNLAGSKLRAIDEAIEVFEALKGLAARCALEHCESSGKGAANRIDHDVREVLSKVRDCDVLSKIAVLSYVIAFPQKAGDEDVDKVFDASWNEALRRLSSMRSTEAIAALRAIDGALNTQGGEKMVLQSLIRDAEARLSEKRR